jgi:hypothetical protein
LFEALGDRAQRILVRAGRFSNGDTEPLGNG